MDQAIRSRRAQRIGSRGFASRVAALASFTLLLALLAASWACTPKIIVETPKEPIEINLNIKIEHEIRVKVDDDLEQLFEDDDELF